MSQPPDGPDNLEGMAFQLLLQKVTSLEHAMQALPPLLKKIIDHLEAQAKQPEIQVATYAQLYPELEEDGGETDTPAEPSALHPAQPAHRHGFWRWFFKEHA